jgi:MFS family permease
VTSQNLNKQQLLGVNTTQQLSFSATARGLRALIFSHGAWGAWAQMVSLQTAIFTGFVLWLGASEASIAYFISIGSFSSLAQILSSTLLIHRIKRKKAFVICMGSLHTLFRFSVVIIPLILTSYHVPVIATLIGIGMVCWHSAGPIFSGWSAEIIPEDIRARFLGRQTIANLLAGIVASYAAGWYLDLFADTDKYTGFFTIFLLATLIGIGGFVNLSRVPFQQKVSGDQTGNLFVPFRNKQFRNLLIFFWVWNFAWSVGSPFYSVFMLKTLKISYSNVAILTSLFMAAMVIGSQLLSGLVDRYGSKAMLQILTIPSILTPVFWALNRPDFYWFIPLAMILNGLIFSGMLVSVNALLYATVPEEGNRTTYFAGWSCAVFLAYAVAPLFGSALVKWFAPIHLQFWGYDIGNLQLVFLVSAGLMIIPNILLRAVEDNKGTTSRELLGQVGRGNLVGYLYNALVFDWARNDNYRARAIRKMGRSRSPMALDQLIQALNDANPDVRRQAAHGLGETGATEAIDPLLDELRDQESDIRGEAAEALGKIGDHDVIDPLIEALDDSDTRVQISAIRALADIGGAEARELLFWKFVDHFDRTTFPTLADVLGAKRDLRMVRPTLERIEHFRSPAIRLQLLNAVCRAVGARRRFYRFISQDPLTRASNLDEMLKTTRQVFKKDRILPRAVRMRICTHLDNIHQAFDKDNTASLLTATLTLAEYIKTETDEKTVETLGSEIASQIGAAILALHIFLDNVAKHEKEETQILFLIVMLWCIAKALESAH